MAHYLDIHSIDKELVKGIAVISFTDNSNFENKMEKVLSVTRCSFNNVFRDYFDVNSEWDNNYFVIKTEHIRFLIDQLNHEKAKGDESSIYDDGDFETVMACLTKLQRNKDPDSTYLISWEK